MTLTIEAKQPPLPFRLALRRHKRVKLSEGQLELFVEKPFDSRALLSSIFDFTPVSAQTAHTMALAAPVVKALSLSFQL